MKIIALVFIFYIFFANEGFIEVEAKSESLSNNSVDDDSDSGSIEIPVRPQNRELSSSQQNFFKMLDEKIENGPDYDSNDETEVALETARLHTLLKDWETASASSRSLPSTPRHNPRCAGERQIHSAPKTHSRIPPNVIHQSYGVATPVSYRQTNYNPTYQSHSPSHQPHYIPNVSKITPGMQYQDYNSGYVQPNYAIPRQYTQPNVIPNTVSGSPIHYTNNSPKLKYHQSQSHVNMDKYSQGPGHPTLEHKYPPNTEPKYHPTQGYQNPVQNLEHRYPQTHPTLEHKYPQTQGHPSLEHKYPQMPHQSLEHKYPQTSHQSLEHKYPQTPGHSNLDKYQHPSLEHKYPQTQGHSSLEQKYPQTQGHSNMGTNMAPNMASNMASNMAPNVGSSLGYGPVVQNSPPHKMYVTSQGQGYTNGELIIQQQLYNQQLQYQQSREYQQYRQSREQLLVQQQLCGSGYGAPPPSRGYQSNVHVPIVAVMPQNEQSPPLSLQRKQRQYSQEMT